MPTQWTLKKKEKNETIDNCSITKQPLKFKVGGETAVTIYHPSGETPYHGECIFLGCGEHHSMVTGITCRLLSGVLIVMRPLDYWTIPYRSISNMQTLIFLIQITQNIEVGIVLKFIIAFERLKFRYRAW